MTTSLPISSINVAERIRRDLGDITSLAESISSIGLLSPIILNESYTLLAGERRLEACKSLGWTEIPVIIKSTVSAEADILVEIEENEKRKSFSKEERVLAGMQLEKIEKIIAETRMKSGKTDPVVNLPQGHQAPKVRDIVAAKLNMSGSQYDHEKYIYNHKDDLDPQVYADWNSGVLSTNAVYKEIKELSTPKKKKKSSKPKEIIKEVQVVPEDYEEIQEALSKAKSELNEYIDKYNLEKKNGFNARLANTNLKDEIERLTNEINNIKKETDTSGIVMRLNEALAENAELKAENEQLREDTETFNNAAYLEREKKDVYRAVDGTDQLHTLCAKIRDMIEEDLAPMKFRRCFERVGVSNVATENFKDMLELVKTWTQEMDSILNKTDGKVIDMEARII